MAIVYWVTAPRPTTEGPFIEPWSVGSPWAAWTGITNADVTIMHNTMVNEISAFFV